ncbi:MAG: type II toxin-antitoxin system RelE/ParE family toxin [Alphaproteobacteria bacterium]|nr:type II toxin-antitoxin system RelE/ParE family toxin [Alphaproteobacteria bacterium]
MRIHITPPATTDLAEGRDYYQAIDFELGERFIREVRARIQTLAKLPHGGRPGRIAGTRELSLPEWRRIAIYRIAGDAIHVLRVWHTAQDWPPRPESA